MRLGRSSTGHKERARTPLKGRPPLPKFTFWLTKFLSTSVSTNPPTLSQTAHIFPQILRKFFETVILTFGMDILTMIMVKNDSWTPTYVVTASPIFRDACHKQKILHSYYNTILGFEKRKWKSLIRADHLVACPPELQDPTGRGSGICTGWELPHPKIFNVLLCINTKTFVM